VWPAHVLFGVRQQIDARAPVFPPGFADIGWRGSGACLRKAHHAERDGYVDEPGTFGPRMFSSASVSRLTPERLSFRPDLRISVGEVRGLTCEWFITPNVMATLTSLARLARACSLRRPSAD